MPEKLRDAIAAIYTDLTIIESDDSILWPSIERVLLEVRHLNPTASPGKIARAVQLMIDMEHDRGNHRRARHLQAWRLGMTGKPDRAREFR